MRVLPIALLAACVAWAGPDPSASTQPIPARDAHRAASIGAPNDGHLDGGMQLDKRAYLRVVPYYADSHARWGLPGLVGLIDHAARHVAAQYPGAVLGVGDLSLSHGGALARHRSHESGRDADIAYYLTNKAGKPASLDQFAPVLPDGTVRDRPDLHFDDAKNWTLIQALLEGGAAVVSQVFVAPHVRARLLRYAERIGVPVAVRERAAERMLQPRGAPLHDDHFHVRVACPSEARSVCVEYASAISLRSPAAPPLVKSRQRAGSPALATSPSTARAAAVSLVSVDSSRTSGTATKERASLPAPARPALR